MKYPEVVDKHIECSLPTIGFAAHLNDRIFHFLGDEKLLVYLQQENNRTGSN